MSNFYRAIQKTFQFRFHIFAAVFCAMMVSILWGGNIGAVVYPLTEICLKQSTFKDWIDQRLDNYREKIVSLEQSIQSIEATQPINFKQLDILKKQQMFQRKNMEFCQYVRPWVVRYTPKGPFQTVVFLMAVILIGTVLKIVFIVLHGILSAWIAQHTAMQIREEFFRKVVNYEVGYFGRVGVADMMSRFTNDMTSLTMGLNIIYGKIIREPLKMFVCLFGAAWISWQLLLLTLLFVPLAGYCIAWLAKSIKRVVRRSMEEIAILYARLEETFRSIRVVKAFTRERFEQTKFRRTNRAYCDKAVKIAKYESLANPMIELFGILMICFSIIIGAYLAIGQHTTLLGIPMLSTPLDTGSLVLFFAFLAGAADPARKLSDIFTQFQSAAAAADRIYAMIDREPEIREVEHPIRLSQHKKSIHFEDIFFQYEPDRPILKGVSLDIRFGECIAIVGATGCGKSTMLNLIPRFYDPTSGRVLIDDEPIVQAKLRDLRKQIGLVTQEPVLFDDTVLNNIRYGRGSASNEEVIEAAKKAYAHDFITELSESYDTVVGPAGGQLSGGQRQRIALARAILRDPAIFLLDEATSQIDVASEKMIHDALREFKKDRTTIMITHRLSALDLADRIVVMDAGLIVGVGTHDELLKVCPVYAKLY